MFTACSIPTVFEDVALRFSDSCALRWADGAWTYAELNARANRLAHLLIEAGVKAETPVGVFSLRSPETLLAFLAILKAGGAYVPLDPNHPPDRIKFCLEDAAIPLILADAKERHKLPPTLAKIVPLDGKLGKGRPETNPGLPTGPDSLAHILFTSGSTGRPKGVLIEHRGVVRLAKHIDYMEVGPGETMLQYAPLGFDVSTFEIWVSWLNGGCVALPPANLASLPDFGLAIRSLDVTSLLLAASLMAVMVEQEIESLAGVRQFMVGGDIVSPAHAERFLRRYPRARLLNGYGPTENTVMTSCHTIRLETPMPTTLSIGRPVPKTGVLILDEELKPMPEGEVGEIVITGEGLARGYLNRPDLTERSFIRVAGPSGEMVRAYRSGDLGRFNPDGTLDFHGRRDDQVKINGLRIELGEIKSVLQSHPEVSAAEVVVVDGEGKKRLEIFVVLRPGTDVKERALRDFVREKIPGNWIPSVFHLVSELPLSPNGKVDRGALLASLAPVEAAAVADEVCAPVDFVEKAILGIWREILPGRVIRTTDNFFDIGGDSLSAMNMMAQVEKTVGRKLGLRPLIEGGTIAALAAAAREKGPIAPPPILGCVQPGTGREPFFFAYGDYVHGGLYCRKMAQLIGADLPFYTLAPYGAFGGDLPSNFDEVVTNYLAMIRSVQPKGPYHLGGFCNGAVAIYDVARRLTEAGEKVSTLVMLDPPDLSFFRLQRTALHLFQRAGFSDQFADGAAQRVAESVQTWQDYGLARAFCHVLVRTVSWIGKKFKVVPEPPVTKSAAGTLMPNLHMYHLKILASYQPRSYSGSALTRILLWSEEQHRHPRQMRYWSGLMPNASFGVMQGTHLGLRTSVSELAGILKESLPASA